jgi:hypothetical protein
MPFSMAEARLRNVLAECAGKRRPPSQMQIFSKAFGE